MILKDVNKVVIIGSSVYVPEKVYLAWSPSQQISYVSGQTALGFSVVIQSIPKLEIGSIEGLYNSATTAPSAFLMGLECIYPEADTNVFAEVLMKLEALKETLDNAYKEIVATSGYSFKEPPVDFDLNKSFTITPKRVSRSDDGSDYYLTINEFKRLFNSAFAYWKNSSPCSTYFERSSGCRHRLDISHNTVEIGCQTILRYEMEAIAIHLGFVGYKFI